MVDSLFAAFYDHGDYERTIQQANRILVYNEQNYIVLTLKGAALGGLGRNEEAIAQLTQAIRAQSTYIPAYYWRAVVSYGMRDYENAALDMETVALSEPEDVELQMALASYRMAAGWFAQAIDQYTELLRQDSTLVGENRATALTKRSEAKYRIGDVQGAHADADQALALDLPGMPTYGAYVARGNIYLREDQYGEALDAIEAAIAARPDSVADARVALDFNNRGYGQLMQGDTQAALADINKAQALFPENAFVYRNRALVYLKLGKRTDACADIQRAIELDYTLQFGYDGQYGPPPEELQERYCTPPSEGE